MRAKPKDLMINGAVRLLATRGLQATSFNEVLDLTKAPRGSIYHHFPNGKDQMIAAAIDQAGANTMELLNKKAGSSAVEITEYFLELWRQLLIQSNFRAGCSILAVTIATDSTDLLDHASNVFKMWQMTLTDLLVRSGLNQNSASQFAIQLIATSEGAVVMCRADRDIRSFDIVSESLISAAKML